MYSQMINDESPLLVKDSDTNDSSELDDKLEGYVFEIFEDELGEVGQEKGETPHIEKSESEEILNGAELVEETEAFEEILDGVEPGESSTVGSLGEGELAYDTLNEVPEREEREVRIHSVVELDSEDDIDNLEELEQKGATQLKDQVQEGALQVFQELQQENKGLEGYSTAEPIGIDIEITIFERRYKLAPIEGVDAELDFSTKESFYTPDKIANLSIEKFFGQLRLDPHLKAIKDISLDQELVLEVPELELVITEDNVYTRDITIRDYLLSFVRLRRNSAAESVPRFMTFNITLKPRFIAHFNKLSELIRSGKGFKELRESDEDDMTSGANLKRRRIGE